jgi:NTP pyrophosphatase (non-canonical NTP hydrolase)
MNILEKAVEKYGEKQLDQAQEELAELIVAISKYKRNENKFTISNVIEEIADVNIMIKQVMMLLDIKEFEVKSEEIYKLNRLKKRILKDEPV